MREFWEFIVQNKDWIFSGIGVFAFGLLLAVFRRKGKQKAGDTITTHGDQSPGKVEGDYKVEIHERKGKKIETHGDLSPGIVKGDFKVNQTIVRQYNVAKKKRWRQLDEVVYPAIEDTHERRGIYASHLALHLHRTFKSKGYMRFSCLFGIHHGVAEGDPCPYYNLISNQANFTGSLRSTWKTLWNPNVPLHEREELQNQLNTELMSLGQSWALSLNLPFAERLVACQFIYDGDGRKITIGPPDVSSTNPGDYPDKLHTTSELLTFLSVITGSQLVIWDDIDFITSHYPLFKLALEVLDRNGWRPSHIRVNVEDYEEWDYINPAADTEVRHYSDKLVHDNNDTRA